MALPKYQNLAQAILYELYLIVTGGETDGRDLNYIHEIFFDSKIPKNYLNKICKELLKEGYLSEELDDTPFETEYFAITGKGISHVEHQLELPNSIIKIYADRGKYWLLENSGDSAEVTKSVDQKESPKSERPILQEQAGAGELGNVEPDLEFPVHENLPGEINYDRLDIFLLGTMLIAAYNRESEGYLSIESFYIRDPLHTDRNLIARRLNELENRGLVITASAPYRGAVGIPEKMYKLSVEGIHFAIQQTMTFSEQEHGLTENLPEEIVVTLHKIWAWYASAIGHPIQDAGQLVPNTLIDHIPASDRTVTLDHNSQDYKNAISSLERVIQEFRQDHHLDNELGHEKGALLKVLDGGRELLNDSTINMRIGVALIVEPLKRIAEKYDQALVGALATATLGLILKLLGLN